MARLQVIVFFAVAAVGWTGHAQAPAPLPRDTTDADARTLAWFASNGSPIAAIDGAPNGADLARWDALTNSARIIGIGEQTHGTSEFSRMKLRLITHGVLTQQVSVVGLENVPAPVLPINRFLHGEAANVDSLMLGLSRLWRTEELKSVIMWLRSHNEAQRRRGAREVDMIGIDVQNGGGARDSMMAETIVAAIEARPAGERAMIWSHNVHVAYIPTRIGPQLRRMIGTRYVALGFATARGTYRAHAPSDSGRMLSDGHALVPSSTGSVELSLSRLSAQVGGVAQLYDVRTIVADARGGWLKTARDFHFIGTNTDEKSVQVWNVGEAFDLLLFIPSTTSSRSVPGIQ
ncbi:MAG: erythromycin esterase family protein [Gemmatimonadota bacterium]